MSNNVLDLKLDSINRYSYYSIFQTISNDRKYYVLKAHFPISSDAQLSLVFATFQVAIFPRFLIDSPVIRIIFVKPRTKRVTISTTVVVKSVIKHKSVI